MKKFFKIILLILLFISFILVSPDKTFAAKKTNNTTNTPPTNTQSYKTKFKLVMRDSNNKVIKSIPAKSIIEVNGKDPKNKNRVIATFNGITGSVLNSGLVKISTSSKSTSTKETTKATTTTTAKTTTKASTTTKPTTNATTTTTKNTTKATTDNSKYKYFARIKTKCNLVDKNGKKLKELGKNEFVKVISISSNQAKVEWYGKTGFVPKKKIEQTKNAIFISIEKQTQTLIRNGEIIVTTPVVTGCTSNGKDTPKGSFAIIDMKKTKITENKKTHKTTKKRVKLSGTNSNGTTYTSYVDYWMRITNSGVGIHDADWREKNGIKFGGTIYKTKGSHGCINTPSKVMQTIYENSYVGLPVYIQ